MKRYIFLFLAVLSFLAGHAQGGYDPENPGDPNPYRKLTLLASPKAGGSVNSNKGSQVGVGQEVTCRASANTYYEFVHWTKNGEVVSTNNRYTFVMPDEDVELIAVFEYNYEYNPTSPGDPQEIKPSHRVTLTASPGKGGRFNSSVFKMYEGDSTNVYAYPNEGYKFQEWQMNGVVVSRKNPMMVKMGNKDLAYTATFVYEPTSPSDPGVNMFNPTTGEMIVDRFEAGRLSDAISNLLGRDYDYSQIQSLTVSGVMKSSDFGFAYRLSNCSKIDLSRTNGYSEIPSYAFESASALTELLLPSCVGSIGRYAFSGCSNLSELTCYAIIPPTLSYGALSGLDKSVIIRVPAQSLDLYKNADGWKDFTILPADSSLYTLTVSLPADAADGRYKNMSIELLNIGNSQRFKYLITDKTEYAFSNLLSSTSYNVAVKNSKNEVLGELTGIDIIDKDVKVAFESLRQPKTVSIKVLTPKNQDVTSDVTVKWYDKDGNLLHQGISVSGVLEKSEIAYSVSLPQNLLSEYLTPANQKYIVAEQNNILTLTLEAIGKTTLAGTVCNENGKPISNAVLAISQCINGTYTNSVTATTNADGKYEIEVSNVPLKVTISANGYVSQTKELANASDGLGNLALVKITGLTIATSYTFQESVVGEPSEPTDWYSDNSNIAYRVEDGAGNELDGCVYQGSSIVLPNTVSVGDELNVIAYSKTGKFKDVSLTVSLAGKTTYVTFPIVEYGGINIKCANDAFGSICILYDNDGTQVGKASLRDNAATFSALPDGNYTVVSMKKSSLFNSVLNLSALESTGLTQGSDYLKNEVNVSSGAISEVALSEIPQLDETKLYYTANDGTYFMPNKSQITIGNYLTLKSKVTIKDDYINKINAATLVVDIPASCEFVENSVISVSGYLGYSVDGNRISIPMAQLGDVIRFCIIPLEGGECKPNAFVKLIVDNEEVLQPIGSAYFEAKNFSLSAPQKTSKTTIVVRGTATANSEVSIYDNGTLAAKTYSMPNGEWSTKISFVKPYTHSLHELYGEVMTKDGKRLLTKSQMVDYDQSYIDLAKVTMVYNGNKIVFDQINGKTTPSSYSYVPGKDAFTFIADFTENNPEKISNVFFKVLASDGSTRTLPAEYNEPTRNWVASTKYSDSNKLPMNATAEYVCNVEAQIDAANYNNAINSYNNDIRDFKEEMSRIDELLQKLSDEWEKDIPDEDLVAEYKGLLYNELGIDVTGEVTVYDENNIQELIDQCDAILNSEESLKVENIFSQTYAELSEFMEGITISTCERLNPQSLISEGFVSYEKSDGSTVYIYTSEDWMKVADFANNIYYVIDLSNQASFFAKSIRKAQGSEDFVSNLQAFCEGLNKGFDRFISLMSSFADTVDDIERKMVYLLEDKITPELLNLDESIKYLEKNKGNKILCSLLKTKYSALCKEAALCDKIHSWLQKNISTNGLRKGRLGGGAFAVFDIFRLRDDMLQDLSSVIDIYYKIPEPCEQDQAKANSLRNAVMVMGIAAGIFYTAQIVSDAVIISSAILGTESALISGGSSLSAVGLAIGLAVANFVAMDIYDDIFRKGLNSLELQIKKLKCKKDDDDDDDEDKDEEKNDGNVNGNSGGNENYPTPPTTPSIDPSGYVYEAVPSNRVQGVTATAFYKQQTEDMYGDITEMAVVWDASPFGQENPLITDEQGMYAWDVPAGMWQVKFEKEGYETTQSEWLPVPPPQLDVNVAITQTKQPEVKIVHAYADGVTIEFDKFMLPSTLTFGNITVSQNGKLVEGTVTAVNMEIDAKGNAYCSKVEFKPNAELAEGEATLFVSKAVKSYANINMSDDFTQTFTIEPRISEINCDIISLPCGTTKTVEVTILPITAAKGKYVFIESLNDAIATVSTDNVLVDENGVVKFDVTGLIVGSGSVKLSVEGYDCSTIVDVNVTTAVPQVANPVASIPSGEVKKGTEVYLSCETEGATIYYSTDGSCPCDPATAKVYDGTPIVINKSMTLKAMAQALDYYESDVVEYTYTVNVADAVESITIDDDLKMYPLPVRDKLNISACDKTINCVTVVTLNGSIALSVNNPTKEVQLDVHSLTPGIYIINVSTADKIYNRKVLKR